jgi:hypothetical protein
VYARARFAGQGLRGHRTRFARLALLDPSHHQQASALNLLQEDYSRPNLKSESFWLQKKSFV